MIPRSRDPSWDEDDQGWDRAADADPDPRWPGADSWVVLKFGGTSVTGLQSWETIRRILRTRLDEGLRPVVVCSALSGASDRLRGLAEVAAAGGDIDAELGAIRALHVEQAEAMGLDDEEHLGELFEDLSRLARGGRDIGEVSPRLRARILSAGELMSTRLGAAWLSRAEVATSWQDARELLSSLPESELERRFGSARCSYEPDPQLMDSFDALDGEVVLTQGFIAADSEGHTVLLGRGGSDTSAAYLAARLQARRLEIWTDVPGMFTADPHRIPSARLLRRLDYDEARELATMGAKVLHPRCLRPVKEQGIPLHICCTKAPEMEGTVVTARASSGRAQVKALSTRKGIALVSMDTVGMWQQVGFLAEAFAIFARHGLSIDLVATSETNVTVSLDPAANTLAKPTLDGLLEDLAAVCRPKLIAPAASVSVVGRRIRATLHRLGGAFERFADREIHLMSQAASDLNLSFVVDEADADPLMRDLHAQLFSDTSDPVFGPSWEEVFQPRAAPAIFSGWWTARRAELLAEADRGTPVYVYSASELDRAADELLGLESVDRIFYAVKANTNAEVVRRLHDRGLGMECVSPGEIRRVREICPSADILFSPIFAPPGDYQAGFEAGCRVTLDSTYPLQRWPALFRGREILVRLDPGRGGGHHRYVVTAGDRSKFGVPPEEIEHLIELSRRHDVRVVGLHAHAGSGMKAVTRWRDIAEFLVEVAGELPEVQALDLGGGLPVQSGPGQGPLDMAEVDASLAEIRRGSPYELWLEPGRYLVSLAGVLLARVSQVKSKGDRRYVGVDAGMHSLIRPALYGARHEVLNLTRLGEPGAIVADIVGPICETGDILGRGRRLPETHESDVLLVCNAGAYGFTMSSDYNLRGRPREVMFTEP